MDDQHAAASLLQAQTGQLLSDFLLGESPGGEPRRRERGGGRGRRPDFRIPKAQVLDGGERLQIIDTLIAVIGGVYCHLPQKRAAYALDPVQALQLLRAQVVALSEGEFHLALTSIISGLRDAHTRYSGPAAKQGAVAALPFLVEQYGPYDAPTFVVSKVSAPELIKDARFKSGVILESWNSIPFARAVDLHADRETGGRPDARRARALESLTFRALECGPPPDEMAVDIAYRAPPRGTLRETRIPWRVVQPERAQINHQPGSRASRYIAADPAAEAVRRTKKLMFSGNVWEADRSGTAIAHDEKRVKWIRTRFQDALAARIVKNSSSGDLGYLRIWSFDVEDDDAFIAEVMRLLDILPDNGLILDLRGNPGGLIWAAERLLQLFTPNTIKPARFSLLASPMTRAMASSPFNRMEFEAWLPSLEAAIATGEPYSQPLPLTDPAWCNDIGQKYGGPVVCVVDPNTYSAGDLFAAGFVDNEIGPVVCVGEATGAGGANVWTHFDLREALRGTSFELSVLPPDVGYTLAIRRALRCGAADGLPIEDLGVPGIAYEMTLDDLLQENRDLIAFCAGLLSGIPRTVMKVQIDERTVSITTRGLDELETYMNGRPFEAVRRISDGAHQLPRPDAEIIEFVGRRNGEICQRRRLGLNAG
ncbi:peptidase S41-like protein [Nitrosospira multiformis]|uniref:Peptidase S41-like protein n=1 Tax=Nitrosospira multiformis TaxID=1231 RepID=A0A2T5I732_9PROT|nr:S41 family peptidase [Nitrosospira multiformis]PTQ79644.1 peptidase S41-like protein [Nitrosospira multiformis]